METFFRLFSFFGVCRQNIFFNDLTTLCESCSKI
jgi:hypothetical protein